MAAPPRPRSPLAMTKWGIRLQRDPFTALLDLHRQFGPVVDLGLGRLRYVFAFGAEANERIITAPPSQLRWREALAALIPIDGDTALVVTDGPEHDRRRRLVQPAFSTRAVHAHVPMMAEEVAAVIDGWSPGQRVDAYEELRAVIRRIVIRALFGDRMRARADELGELLQPMLEFVNRPLTTQVKLNAPGTLWRRASRAKAEADRLVFDEIALRRTQRTRTGASDVDARDVLGVLVAAQEGGVGLTDDEIRDQVISLIAAGYDTTSAAVAWLVHELLANPGVWEAARAEVEAVVGDSALTSEHLRDLRVVDGIVSEVLRLRPPGAVSGRYVVEPFDVCGVTVPPGRTVIYSAFVTQRLPELWPDPDVFRPERWDPARPDYVEPRPYSFVPFGSGARRCIGFGFATIELKVICAELVRRTRLVLEESPMRLTGIAAMRPRHGVPVRVADVHLGAFR